ncbi:MAG TPA: hypothetical protein VGH15_11645 [Caulobacteraceae bacterium]
MSAPETLSEADFQKVRAYHRGTRNAALVACLVGVLVMIAGRYVGPDWLVAVGVAIIALGWALFAYAFVKRLKMARASLPPPGGVPAKPGRGAPEPGANALSTAARSPSPSGGGE